MARTDEPRPDTAARPAPHRATDQVATDRTAARARLAKFACVVLIGLGLPLAMMTGAAGNDHALDPAFAGAADPARAATTDDPGAPATGGDVTDVAAAPSGTDAPIPADAPSITGAPTTVAPATSSSTTTTSVPATSTSTSSTTSPVTTSTTWAPPTTVARTTATPAGGEAFLACVRHRESRGDYGVVNPSSGTAGAYQFAQVTWDTAARAAGRTDLVGVRPHQASPAAQDQLARTLYQVAGAGPWGGGC